MKHIFSLLREFIFPAGCGACDEELFTAQEAWLGICSACQEHFAIPKCERCSICGRPLLAENNTCIDCRTRSPHHFDRLNTLYPYSGIYSKLLSSYKFDKKVNIGNFFTNKLLEALTLFPNDLLQAAVFVPVPPRSGKIKEMNFDQIEVLAQKLKRRGLPVTRCLKRLPSRSQKELSGKERLVNLHNKIRCIAKPPPKAILFDDVITSGATMDACAEALKSSGCENVFGICLFYD